MRKKMYLAASVFTLLVCMGIASSQHGAAYAEGVTFPPSATKDGDPRVTRQITGSIVGIKRLSLRVWLIMLDNGMKILVNPATDGPVENGSINFTKVTVTYVDQDSHAGAIVAKSIKIEPSTPPTPTPTATPTVCVIEFSCSGTTDTAGQR